MSDKTVQRLNEAGIRVAAARDALSNHIWDLQLAAERLLPLPIPIDIHRFEPLLAHCELRMRETRAALEVLAVRLEQLRRLAAVAARQ